MNIRKSKLFNCIAVATLAFGFAFTAVAAEPAAVAKPMPGQITRKDGTKISGNIRWMSQGRKYIVSQSNKDGRSISTDVPLSDVARVETRKPEKLEAAIRAVETGKGAAAIPVLAQIVKQYEMLGWDEPATRYLAQATLDSGKADVAVAICEKIIKVKPEAAYLGDVAPIYWQALLATNKKAKLTELIGKAIATGDRYASASALIMRGDMFMEQKEPMNALKDGYLRVVVLYENVRAVQPEALFKAAKAFEALSQNNNAEKFRSTLRSKFPKSSYAKQL